MAPEWRLGRESSHELVNIYLCCSGDASSASCCRWERSARCGSRIVNFSSSLLHLVSICFVPGQNSTIGKTRQK